MLRRTFIKKAGTAGLIIFIPNPKAFSESNINSSAGLEEIFQRPPSSAYPLVFWFWMNGNVSEEGITHDLEAMKEVGIAGVFNFDVGTGIPKGPIKYLSEEWLRLKRFAMQEADRLGLEFTMHNCPGWSASGGPWITPELAMQEITWSEAYVGGGKQVNVALPKPLNRFDHYKDIVVLAFPSLEGEAFLQTMRVSSAKGEIDIKKISGQDPGGAIVFPAEASPAWLQFEFEKPLEARTVTFFISSANAREPQLSDFSERTSVMLEASDDGIQFHPVTLINTGVEAGLLAGDKFITYDIPVTTAKFFRFTSLAARRYKQVRFSGIIRLENWMEKTNSRATTIVYVEKASGMFENDSRNIPSSSVIKENTMLDITKHTDRNGVLQWDAPPGAWTILRIGFTPSGRMIRSAPDEGTGLECDKYNRAAMELHFNKMTEGLLPLIAKLAANGKMGLEIDSYEAGAQNWTAGFDDLFHKRWGYDLLQYLPAVAGGHIVGNVETTESFLWDFRRLQAELIASNYYGRFAELCRENGITSCIEPYDQGPMEEMQIGSEVDVNLGEFWNGISTTFPFRSPVRRTLKLAAAIAHTNSQKISGAEAFTAEPDSSRWTEYPFCMKATGDKAFAKGVNRLVIHRFAHQPNSFALPGMTMGPWGIHFDRTNTWWKQGKEWISYIARCEAMLQQGHFVADLLYFTGQDSNIFTRVERDELDPAPPSGYDYDLANADTILKKIKIVNNRIVLPDGMSYRVLVFQNYRAVTHELLLKLRELVQDGMILIGERPKSLLGLGNRIDEDEFQRITNEVWGNIDGNLVTENRFGRGRVFWVSDVYSVLENMQIERDFELSSRSGDAPIIYIHRKSSDADIYFLSNQRRTYEDTVCTFRVANRQPEFWDAATGRITSAPIYELIGDNIRMPVQFEPYGSVFIVFRSQAATHFHSLKKDNITVIGTQPFSASRKLYKDITDNFTISFWAKPEMNILLYPNVVSGSVGEVWTEYFAIYPPPGEQLYGAGHATCGVTVGRNGVAVWEHGDGKLLVMSTEVRVEGWSHIVLIYKEGVPSFYVNGKFISEGKKSKLTIHPGLGEAYIDEGASYFNGDMSEPVLFNESLTKDEIHDLATMSQPTLLRAPFVAEIALQKKPALLIRQNGKYSLKKSNGEVTTFDISNIEEGFELEGPWQVSFPPHLGAPLQITLPKLISLHLHPDEGVKYFSGTVIYTNSFSFSREGLSSEKRVVLDVGRVEVIADLIINEVNVATLWKRPYSVDITDAIRDGHNKLEIRVTNLWPNRLIGDEHLPDTDKFTEGAGSSGEKSVTGGAIEQLPGWYVQGKPKPADGRICFATWKHFTKESPLLESGLIGPVILHTTILKWI